MNEYSSSLKTLNLDFQSLKCDSCDKEFHLHCLVATSGGRRDSSVCNACKAQITFYDIVQEEEDTDEVGDKDGEKDEDDTVRAVVIFHSVVLNRGNWKVYIYFRNTFCVGVDYVS